MFLLKKGKFLKNNNYALLCYGVDAGLSSLGAGSVVISSIGFGGGVVAIVQPIHAPMNIIATKAMKTGTAITHSLKLSSAIFTFNGPVIQPGANNAIM